MNIKITFKCRAFYGTEYENHLDIGNDVATGTQVLSPDAARELADRLRMAAGLADRMTEIERDIAACSAVIGSGHPIKTEQPESTAPVLPEV